MSDTPLVDAELTKIVRGDLRHSVDSVHYMLVLARSLERANAELVGALEELCELMDAVRDGSYKPDSFTTQPARAALSRAKGESCK